MFTVFGLSALAKISNKFVSELRSYELRLTVSSVPTQMLIKCQIICCFHCYLNTFCVVDKQLATSQTIACLIHSLQVVV